MKFPVRMVGAHGAMHAYSESELAYLQSLGWSVEKPEPPKVNEYAEPGELINLPSAEETLKAALAESMRLDPPIVLPVVTEPPKRKPGRPAKAK